MFFFSVFSLILGIWSSATVPVAMQCFPTFNIPYTMSFGQKWSGPCFQKCCLYCSGFMQVMSPTHPYIQKELQWIIRSIVGDHVLDNYPFFWKHNFAFSHNFRTNSLTCWETSTLAQNTALNLSTYKLQPLWNEKFDPGHWRSSPMFGLCCTTWRKIWSGAIVASVAAQQAHLSRFRVVMLIILCSYSALSETDSS